MNRDKKVWGALLIVLFNRSIFRYIEALWTNNMIFGNVLKGVKRYRNLRGNLCINKMFA